MRVLVTGSRTWEDEGTVHSVLDAIAKEVFAAGFEQLTVVHGACPRGADAHADSWVAKASASWPVQAERHWALWKVEGRAAGFRRNERMVEAGADLCLAFIRDASAGATHCAGLAERAGITVRRFEA